MDAEFKIKGKISNLLGARIATYFPTNPIHHEALWLNATFENLRMSAICSNTEAIEIACILIEQDPTWLPFGKLSKSNLARALKKNASEISPSNPARIIAATVRLLQAAHSPRKLEDYAKLVKKFPTSEYASQISAVVPISEKARGIQGYLNDYP